MTSSSWIFEGSLARNAFLRDSRCTKPYVFPYKVRPRTSMIYLCGATGARRSRVWSDHVRIMGGSCSDRFRIVNGVSPVFRACAVDIIPLWFATVGSFPQCKWDCKWCWWMSCRWNSIVICNCRIVPAMQMALQVVLVEELPMEFWRKSRTKCVFEREQMHETLCFSIQSPSPNLDDLPLRCDGCETVSCVVGSCSDHGRIMLGSVPHCKWGFTCVSCMCGRQNSIVICNCRIVPAM